MVARIQVNLMRPTASIFVHITDVFENSVNITSYDGTLGEECEQNHPLQIDEPALDRLQDDYDDQGEPEAAEDAGDLYERLVEDQRESSARYILRMKEINSLTEKAVDDVVSSTSDIIQVVVDNLRNGIYNRLDSAGIDMDAVPGLSDLFKDDNPISNPFAGLTSKSGQVKAFKELFDLVVSIKF